ncbi:MAG: ThiF family adenylyltransferase [Lentimonas sp.]
MSYIARIAETCNSIAFSQEELSYYARHFLLPSIGTIGQQKLKCARVLVVGAGGIGCPVLQALAGAGVGRLTIADGDAVALSNLSRQWLHRHSDVGLNKAESAKQQLVKLNPSIEVDVVASMLDDSNAQELIADHDLVVDATDDMDVRYLIDTVSAEFNHPWVHAALYRDNSQLCVFWEKCGARFRDLFPERSEAPSCAGAGILGAVASVAANLQALEVVKLIVGSSVPKVGTVVLIHAANYQIQSFQLPGIAPPEFIQTESEQLPLHSWSMDQLCQAQSIDAPLRLIDLRSDAQQAALPLDGAESMSAERILELGLGEELSTTVLLVCDAGIVSSLLADALRSRGHSNVFHLEAGYSI